jgi:hypothetical protein
MLAMRVGGQTRTQTLADGDGLAALAPWLAERPGQAWRVWLGGSLCGLHLADPIEGVAGIEEAEAALSVSLSGDEPKRARLAGWPAPGEPWLAAVTPASLVDDLVGVMAQSGGSLLLCRPWWSAASSRVKGSTAFFDGETVTYWRSSAGREITSAATQPARDRVQAEQLLQRLQIGGAVSAWQIDLGAELAAGTAGFAVVALEERAHAARAAAV